MFQIYAFILWSQVNASQGERCWCHFVGDLPCAHRPMIRWCMHWFLSIKYKQVYLQSTQCLEWVNLPCIYSICTFTLLYGASRMDYVHLHGFSLLQYFCAYFAFALFDRSAKAQEWTMLPPSKTRYFKFSVGGILCVFCICRICTLIIRLLREWMMRACESQSGNQLNVTTRQTPNMAPNIISAR